jgi:hypothetical protein
MMNPTDDLAMLPPIQSGEQDTDIRMDGGLTQIWSAICELRSAIAQIMWAHVPCDPEREHACTHMPEIEEFAGRYVGLLAIFWRGIRTAASLPMDEGAVGIRRGGIIVTVDDPGKGVVGRLRPFTQSAGDSLLGTAPHQPN